MKKTIIAALALVVMAGCNKTLIEMPVVDDAGYGYINFDISADSDMVVTKAIDTEDCLVTLQKCSSANGTFDAAWDSAKKFSDIQDDDTSVEGKQVKIESGQYYKIIVENNTHNAIYSQNDNKGDKHFYGESEAKQLVAGGNIELAVECKVINTAVSVKPTANFTNTFKNEVVTVSVDNRSWKFINVENEEAAAPVSETPVSFNGADMVYFPANTLEDTSGDSYYYADLSIQIKAATEASATEKTYTISRRSKRAHWTQITLDAGQNGAIKVTITATDDMNETPVSETVTLDPLTNQEVQQPENENN